MEIEVAPGRVLAVTQGDITRIPADAIVNAANRDLRGGGGVDGAIHRVGGPEIMTDLGRRYGPIGVRRCPTGRAVVTDAGRLPARWVLHAVGPVWESGRQGEPEALASAYATCLRLAEGLGARHVTFPSISTGVYGFPEDLAADIAIETAIGGLRAAQSLERVTLVGYSTSGHLFLEAALVRYLEGA